MFNATTERRLTSWVSPERPERRRQGTGTHAQATPTVLPERGTFGRVSPVPITWRHCDAQ